ncbi:Phosphotransferase system mannitol/fructose-specific IIA domain (Ntr-type) [Methylacidimicrobium sp. AP8]|uniref:PTS sugar transporter subunit IIA n=1 Tax=Methylacidimicrobium sp. AP8 TaxID=2730359 RepID=UPI0018C11056|nr:PTS sugar transporter subunit IIA [Methylacidimicrobium sp. AP8]CAB4242590.1 Phosphotransferase system mannitol/fructose-specific IIA domain (Ntr-type) [Methylacidimicrobium sp. AP8]
MKLIDLIKPGRVALNLRARTWTDAMREVAELLREAPEIDDFPVFLEELLAAQGRGHLWFDSEVGFPHVRSTHVRNLVLAAGRSTEGIVIQADQPAVKLVFVIGVPMQFHTEYLIAVGALARIVNKAPSRARLLRAKDPAEFVSLIAAEEQKV